jgi:hypothetical protein
LEVVVVHCHGIQTHAKTEPDSPIAEPKTDMPLGVIDSITRLADPCSPAEQQLGEDERRPLIDSRPGQLTRWGLRECSRNTTNSVTRIAATIDRGVKEAASCSIERHSPNVDALLK